MAAVFQLFRLVAFCLLGISVAHAQNDSFQPPEITYPTNAETLYIVPYYGRQQIKCEATGDPNPTYTWLKGGQPLNRILGIRGVRYNTSSGVLEFSSFSKYDEDVYQCVATNVFVLSGGQQMEVASTSAPVHVLAQIVENFDSLPQEDISGTEFSYQRMACKGQGKIQVPHKTYSYGWYNAVGYRKLTHDSRRFIDADGTLHISYLLQSDGDIGLYRCGVSNGYYIVLGSPTTLTVSPGINNDTDGVPPTFQYSNSYTKAMVGSDAELECFFSGYQPMMPHKPIIKWYSENNIEITPAVGSHDNTEDAVVISADKRKLTIRNVQETDEMTYYCQAFNSIGSSEKQPVVLDVISAPIFLPERQPINMTVSVGSDAVFNCETRSLPGERRPETPEWYINARRMEPYYLVESDRMKYRFSNDHTTLTIVGVERPYDIMCVSCKVSNDYGETWGNGCLNVVDAPQNTSYVPRGLIIRIG